MVRRALAVACAGAVLASCTTLLGIDGDYGDQQRLLPEPEGGAPIDSSSPPADAGSDVEDGGVTADGGCAGHVCNGVCLAGSSCAACPNATMLCVASSTCVAACSACTGSPIECFHCAGASVVRAECYPKNAAASCVSAMYTDHCTCDGGAAASCPGATQVCAAGTCRTCGENGTDGTVCKGPLKQCESATASCHN